MSNGFNCSQIDRSGYVLGSDSGSNTMYVALYTFGWTFSLLCVAVFEYFKKVKNYERLRVRQSLIVYISCFGVLFTYNALPLEGLVGRSNYPCFLKMAFAIGIIPFLGGSLTTKLLIFYFQSAMQRLAVIQQQQRHDTIKRMSRAIDFSSTANPEFAGGQGRRTSGMTGAAVRDSNMDSVDPFTDDLEENQTRIGYLKDLYAGFISILFRGDTKRTENENLREKRLKALAFIQSHRGTLLAVYISLLPVFFFALYLLIAYPEYSHECMGCSHPVVMDLFLVVHAVLIVSVGFFFAYRLFRKTRDDPWGILTESGIMLTVAVMGVVGFILQEFAYVRVVDASGNVVYEHHVLLEISVSGILFIQTFYVVYVAWRYDDNTTRPVSSSPRLARHNQHKKKAAGGGGSNSNNGGGSKRVVAALGAGGDHESKPSSSSSPDRDMRAASRPLQDQQKLQQQRSAQQLSRTSISQISQNEDEAVAGSDLTLSKILANAELLRRFQEHLIGELGIESLLYLQDIAMWKEDFAGLNENTRRVRAKRLVRLYVRPNSRYEININHEMRQALMKLVLSPANEHEQIPRELFDDSVAELHQLLERGGWFLLVRVRDGRERDRERRMNGELTRGLTGAVPRFMRRIQQSQHATYSPSTVTVAEEAP